MRLVFILIELIDDKGKGNKGRMGDKGKGKMDDKGNGKMADKVKGKIADKGKGKMDDKGKGKMDDKGEEKEGKAMVFEKGSKKAKVDLPYLQKRIILISDAFNKFKKETKFKEKKVKVKKVCFYSIESIFLPTESSWIHLTYYNNACRSCIH